MEGTGHSPGGRNPNNSSRTQESGAINVGRHKKIMLFKKIHNQKKSRMTYIQAKM